MAYSEKDKSKVINLYESGMPRVKIAKEEGISLSTVRNWTKETVSAPLSFLTCPQCKKRRRRLNIQQKYCSKSCKNAAAYRRSVQQADGTAAQPRHLSVIVVSVTSRNTATPFVTARSNAGRLPRTNGEKRS